MLGLHRYPSMPSMGFTGTELLDHPANTSTLYSGGATDTPNMPSMGYAGTELLGHPADISYTYESNLVHLMEYTFRS